MAEFYIKAGDRFPVLYTLLKNADDTPMDLTGTTVKFVMRWPDRPDKPIIGGRAALVDDPVSGQVKYEWGVGDTNEAGLYQAEWVVIYPDGRQTVPNNDFTEIRVMENIYDPDSAGSTGAQDDIDAEVVPA